MTGNSAFLKTLRASDIHKHLEALARLRIKIFRDFPYLYEGEMDYERNYMADFASSDNAVVVAAFDGEEMVGAATAAPLMECHREFAPLFESFGYNPYRVFYFGESLLSPQYRGQGLGHKFFDGREAAARATPDMELCAFCAVLRSADHPLRPEGYSPLHSFWQKRGYRRVQDMVGRLSWRDLGEERETEKDMQFWVKAL